jgi:YVTN family beta-propeller protein
MLTLGVDYQSSRKSKEGKECTNMKSATVKGYCGCLIGLWLMLSMTSAAKTVRIYVANYADTTVDVIDPVTNKIVQVIDGIPNPHGVVGSSDGRQVFVSSESEGAPLSYEELQKINKGVLDVVDQKTGKIIKKIALSGRPNNIAITNDGKRILVCIRSGQGAMDVIDTTSLERVKTIPMNGGLHNVFVTSDGKYAVTNSVLAHTVIVIDLQNEKPAWELKLDNETLDMAIESGPGGSASRIFVQLVHLHGFAVVDFATHKEVARIVLPDEPRGFEAEANPDEPSHGMGINPDGKTLWVDSASTRCVFVYSLPDLKLLGYVPTGVLPGWLSFSPDGKNVYVSNILGGTVSVIDTKTLKEVARIPVGNRPMRTAALVLP